MGSMTTVFPAYAGMNRTRYGVMAGLWGVPRLRGDEPHSSTHPLPVVSCSPPTRG